MSLGLLTPEKCQRVRLISDEGPARPSKCCKPGQKTPLDLGQLQLVVVMGRTTIRARPLEANLPFHSGPEAEMLVQGGLRPHLGIGWGSELDNLGYLKVWDHPLL